MTFSSPCTSAMPSPTLITVPTSATVTPVSKFSICCRMISLISFALIGSMIHFRFPISDFRFPFADMISLLQSAIDNWAIGNVLACHLLFNLLQLIAHRPVVDSRTYARHQTADETGIGIELNPHFLSRQAMEPCFQSLLHRRRDRTRR